MFKRFAILNEPKEPGKADLFKKGFYRNKLQNNLHTSNVFKIIPGSL